MSTQSSTNTNTIAASTAGSQAAPSTSGGDSRVGGTDVNSRNSALAPSDWSTAKLENESDSEGEDGEHEELAPPTKKKDLTAYYDVPKSEATSAQERSVRSSEKKSTVNDESDEEEHIWPQPKKGSESKESKVDRLLPGYHEEEARLARLRGSRR